MPTIGDRILAHLLAHPEGATDSELTRALGLKNQAQANQRCHQLADEGPVVRRRVNGRLRNYATGAAQGASPPRRPHHRPGLARRSAQARGPGIGRGMYRAGQPPTCSGRATSSAGSPTRPPTSTASTWWPRRAAANCG